MRISLRAAGLMFVGAMLVGSICVGLMASAVSAAQPEHGDVVYGIGPHSIRLQNKSVRVHVEGQPYEARVGADGRLWLGERAVPLSDEAQSQLRDYHRAVVALEAHGVAIGMAGAKFGLQTAGEVLAGLFTGTADQAGTRADERGEAFRQQALELCQRIDAVRVAQQAAAALTPAFAPYAVLTQHDVDDCAKDARGAKDASAPS